MKFILLHNLYLSSKHVKELPLFIELKFYCTSTLKVGFRAFALSLLLSSYYQGKNNFIRYFFIHHNAI